MPILATIGILLLLALLFGPLWWVKRVLAKHGEERPDLPGTGGEFARHLLDEAKLPDVKVESSDDGDHYDPEHRSVRLLPQHFGGRSVAAVAIAAHEVSHAIQHARAEPAFIRRVELVRQLAWVQRIAMGVLLVLPATAFWGRSAALATLNLAAVVALLGIGVVVHALTLPVEYDASFN